MGDVIVLPVIRIEREPSDGGKARILRRRAARKVVDDLAMDHVDNGTPSDSPYHAPPSDCA